MPARLPTLLPGVANHLPIERSDARQPIVVAASFHLLAALNDDTAVR
jgi:hypothetical protein